MAKIYLFILFCVNFLPIAAQNGRWAWISGDSVVNRNGIYGTRFIPAASNKPGSREGAVSWKDVSDNLWLFGGTGFATESLGFLNDLWKYNRISNQWTWISGSKNTNQLSVYGIKGQANANNIPGARRSAVSWIDASGNLWLFGGLGYDSKTNGLLNDLWKYNTATNQWTWLSGDTTVNQTGIYGTKGIAATRNKPGARRSSISWIDASGNFWLFGGLGYDREKNGLLNDLWKYDTVNNLWTWISGDNIINQYGTYGTKLIAATANKPGARESAVAWIDALNNLWLFGGKGFAADKDGLLNDLWQYNLSSNLWTWVSGDNTVYEVGVYGIRNVAAPGNKPGARSSSISWTDASGILWMFGGEHESVFFNDLWQFNRSNNLWTWVGGDATVNRPGIYGTKGVASANNKPGARRSAVSWKDNLNNYWLFGGGGFAETTGPGYLNDLWRLNQFNLSCPPSVKVVTDSTNCSKIVSNIDPIITPSGYQGTVTYSLSGATTGSGFGSVSGKIFNKGITMVSYRLSNDSSQSCSFSITVNDSTPPIPVILTLADIKGECSVAISSKPKATDNCAGTITGTTNDSLTYTSQGAHIITWNYNDGNGNSTIQKQTVIIKDSTAPVPVIGTLPDITGQCSVTVSVKPKATDNCAGTITATTNDPLTYTSQGTHIITWNYNDGNGNSTIQKQTVIIKDSTAPVPVIGTLPDITGQCSVTVSVKPKATDNCAGTITATTNDPLTYTSQGTHIITWTYNDGNGNSTTQKQIVVIKDSTAPVPVIGTLPDISGQCSVTISVKPKATDNCAGTITATTNDPLTYTSQGTYIITWTYNDGNGNITTQTQKIIVQNASTPVPVIATLPDITGECSASITTRPLAFDNCTGTITGTTNDPLTYNIQGIHIVTWTYIGGNGNSTIQTQKVIVKDRTAPVPAVSALPDVTGECSASVTAKPKATDNCAGTITGTTNDSLTYISQGTHVITWTYNDGNGNSTTQKQTVIIKDSTPPVPVIGILPDMTGQCSVTVSVKPKATDNCAGTITGTTNESLTYASQGTHIITWTYNDGNGNSTTQKQIVVIKDSTPPVPVIGTLPDITGQCSVTVSGKPTATDNCAGTITATTNDPLTYTSQGTYIITWTYNDGNGHSTTQKQIVVIKDSTAPVPVIGTLPDITGQCSVTVSGKPTATDNCAGTITGTTNDPLTYTSQGTYLITWTYNDGNGNSTTQTQKIIVQNTSTPVPVIATLPDITGECSASITTKPLAYDNCAGTIYGTTNDLLTYTSQGTYVITWTYIGGNGSSTVQTQKVIVKDRTAPVPLVSTLPDVTGECSASVTAKPMATDNCAGTITGSTNDPLTYISQGTHVITWTYNDGNGNSTTQKQNVIIKDSTPPVPLIGTLPDITGQCSVTVSGKPKATDNCAGTIIGTTNDSLAFTAQGTHIITWTYNDGNGNSTTQKQNVILKDSTAPVPVVSTLSDITGECSVSVTSKPRATDNCAGTITGTTNDSLTFTAQGTHIITWTYYDGNGNSTTQTQKIIVRNATFPVPILPTLPDITGECFASVTTKPLAYDNCTGTITGITNDSLTYSSQGTYIITWTYIDGSGNSTIQKQNVIVKDRTAPVPVLEALPDITGECSASVSSKPKATDNCAGTITGTTNDSLTYTSQGIRIIIWTYNDGNGNNTIQKQNVIVKDRTAPVPVLEALPDITGECSASVSSKPKATDNCAGTITGTTNDSLTYTSQGTHIITWTYNDGNGNSTIQKQSVIVKDRTAPVPVVQALPDITGECSASVSTKPKATDNCAGTITGTTNDSLTYTSQGIRIITWTYNDGNGNSTIQKQNVVIIDRTAPVAIIATLPDITGECSAFVSTKPKAIDNCAGTITGTTNDPLTYTSQGRFIITWTYNDGNGNSTTQKQNLIIKDRTAPVPDVEALPDRTECLEEMARPTATDNCAGRIIGERVDSVILNSDSYTITWIYKDGNGNSFTQKQNVIKSSLAVNVFPNPTYDYVIFKFNYGCNREKITLRLFDVHGKLLHTNVIANQTFQLKLNYPAGTYIAQLIRGDEKVAIKLIKLSY